MDLPRETEVKFAVPDRKALEERLEILGAIRGPSEPERNVLLDDRGGSLRSKGGVLRLRETGATAILTFKGAREIHSGVKTRVELETEVGDGQITLGLFRELGYFPAFRYEKRRATWRFSNPGRPLVVIDETPIGLFSEIEGEEKAIRALASELGVDESEFLERSYVELYLAARRKDPSLPQDMVFR